MEKAKTLLEIARIISGNDDDVLAEIEESIDNIEAYAQEHLEEFEERNISIKYDSVEDFLTRSNVSVFMMDSNSSIIATYSNAAAFSAVDKKVSVAESYTAITYECETNGETFKVKLATYKSNNGDEQLASIVDSNPGIFSEEDIGGVLTYYCPGSKYDWFDCYAMVIEDKLFVVNIEKGYDKYIEDVLSNIVLQ